MRVNMSVSASISPRNQKSDGSETLEFRSPKFGTEASLVESFCQQWHAPCSRTKLLREIQTPNGYADLLQIRLRKDWKKLIAYSELPSSWVYAISSLPYRKTFDTEYFASLTGVTVRYAQRILQAFEAADVLVRGSAKDHWNKRSQPFLPLLNLISIEAKLRDWNRALEQAVRNKSFADESWVLLDAAHERSLKSNLAEFRSRNVGVLTLSTAGEIKVISRPVEKDWLNVLSKWQVSFEVNKVLSKKESPEYC